MAKESCKKPGRFNDYYLDAPGNGKALCMTDWSDIVHRHTALVWTTAYRLLNNEADAADCFQDTFVSALELSRKETIRNWGGALKSMAVRRALDRLRGRCQESSRFEAFPPAPPVDGKAKEPADAAQSIELAEGLRRALSDIDPTQAQVFSLICLFDFSYAEAAEALNVTANHVGVLLNRAKAALRQRLAVFSPARPDALGRGTQL